MSKFAIFGWKMQLRHNVQKAKTAHLWTIFIIFQTSIPILKSEKSIKGLSRNQYVCTETLSWMALNNTIGILYDISISVGKFVKCHTYIYRIFKSTKIVVFKILSTTKWHMLGSQYNSIKFPNLCLKRRDYTW